METINREEIVTNGCCGKCCEGFTMEYSLEDIKLMKEAILADKDHFIDTLGREKRVRKDSTIDTIIDMLIPLGKTPIEFNGNYTINSWVDKKVKEFEEAGNVADLNKSETVFREGDTWYKYLFTCRHYDTVNKLCGNYENRPGMCKTFGYDNDCQYEGCNFAKTLAKNQITK